MRLPSFQLPTLAALLFAGGVGGCADPQDGREPQGEGTQSAVAAIVVSRTISEAPRDARVQETRIQETGAHESVVRETVVARFVRARQSGGGPAVDESALRLAGLVDTTPPLASCVAAAGPDAALDARVQPRSLELLDVGPLSVEGPSARTLLLPRAMPDPAGVVSGVFYTAGASRAGQALAADSAFGGSAGYAGARISVQANGGDGVDGFVVSGTAPRDVTGLDASMTEQGLDLNWDEGDAESLVFVDVLTSPRAHDVTLRCTMLDSGRFVVPATLLPVGLVPGESQVALHRVRREAFRTRGIEPGELRFDVARIVTIRH